MAQQSIVNLAGSIATGSASAALPTLPSGPSSSSSMSNLLPALPPPTVGTAVGIAATAVMATSLMQPGNSSLTGLATAGLFASSLKNLVLPSGATQTQQQDSMIKGALGLVAVAAVNAIANPNKDSARAEAEAAAAKARDEAKKAHDEAVAARQALEQQRFVYGPANQQRHGQISQAELQAALRDSPTQRDRSKA